MKQNLFILLSIIIMLLLSGCDPCNPAGFRNFGALENDQTQYSKVIALAPNWGPCGYPMYFTTDSGLTWITLPSFSPSNMNDIKSSREDCTESCEFIDLLNDQIHYQIIPGKTLLRSMDGGKTWKDELQVPSWNQMEKNWVIYNFPEIGPTPRDIRGPFGAITDPQTGNLLVAMGFEGILVHPENGNWTWINVDGYGKIQPSRSDMLGLILIQNWVRGPLIMLFVILFGLSKLGFTKFRIFKTILMILTAWLILIPYDANLLIISLIFPKVSPKLDNKLIYELVSTLLVILAMISIILINLRSNRHLYQRIIHKIIVVSILTALGYWFAFVLWSQGILLTTYGYAYLMGITMLIFALIIVHRATKKRSITD